MTSLRIYEPHELGPDGYPEVWHRGLARSVYQAEFFVDPASPLGVKHAVRELAGHRCERCGHPYVVGESGEWEELLTVQAARAAADAGAVIAWEDQVTGHGRPEDEPRVPRVLWSPCDEHCTHGGPIRVREPVEGRDVAWATPVWSRDEKASADRGTITTLFAELAARNEAAPDEPDAVLEVQAAWRVLTVHHLNGDKRDLRWWNLAALCQRCHLSVQRRVRMEQVWPLEHSDWFKPHAAGWYGYAYLGQDLSRAETMQRLDELLALERAS